MVDFDGFGSADELGRLSSCDFRNRAGIDFIADSFEFGVFFDVNRAGVG